ncbi:helix-turn-helix domain-containing protein [Paralimibaculum aggregatum]|uniref:Helix-turn-helix domain-containing protein n=1 Tax=Paralimibaculum aggregatum TaxID=3036245 RepID=A0ABQ6LPM3_9RHOB|nr:helix-turn-helix domain-containing protein [Limibaculum sp. NKW23]GMG82446.1 helix-turn-helix domain-containing protein [Limibaculum sp. NKW23]
MTRHADSVWSAVSSRGDHAPHTLSWRRCVMQHGLDPAAHRRPPRVTEAELRIAAERAGDMVAAAVPEMDRLFEAFGRAGCCLVLTDSTGLALERRGRPGDDAEFRSLGLWSGTLWNEANVGTNGIGTALAEQRSVGIHRDAHFLSMNTGLSCATAPIRDHRGRLAGALDISSARYDMNEALLGVFLHSARGAAQQIETTLFRNAFPGARVVLAPGCASRHGLLALDRDDIVIGATAAARQALGIDDDWIAAGHGAGDLLDEDTGERPAGFEDAERRTVRTALAQCAGNVSAAARMLGISRATLHRKIKRHGLRR